MRTLCKAIVTAVVLLAAVSSLLLEADARPQALIQAAGTRPLLLLPDNRNVSYAARAAAADWNRFVTFEANTVSYTLWYLGEPEAADDIESAAAEWERIQNCSGAAVEVPEVPGTLSVLV